MPVVTGKIPSYFPRLGSIVLLSSINACGRQKRYRTHLAIGACVCVGLLARHSAQFLLNSACLSVESIAFCAVFNKEIAEDAELV